jgi:hypothetical protein
LSGAAVKAGGIGLIRFLPFEDGGADSGWAELLIGRRRGAGARLRQWPVAGLALLLLAVVLWLGGLTAR